MIESRFLARRESNKPVFGFNLRFPSPEIVEFMGYAGFDYVFIDVEHFAFNIETIQSLVRAADLTGMVAIARLYKNEKELILQYLETGVTGIVVPHTKTAEDARAAVHAVKYFPLGQRGAGGNSRAANYGFTHAARAYIREANRRTVAIVLVEEKEGFDNLAEILEVDGIDCVDIGPGDLAMSLGYPGQSNHPEVQALVEKARRQILASNKALAVPVDSVEAARMALEEGAMYVEFSLNPILAREVQNFFAGLRDFRD